MDIGSKSAELEEPGGPSKASLGLLCCAHKKAQTIGETLKLLSPVDTICIRMRLSLQGPVKRHIRRLFRRLICTHLVVIDGSPPPGVDDFRVRFYNLVFSGSAYDRYRKHVCEALFNGKLLRCDRVEHYIRPGTAARSKKKILRLMCTIGVNVLLPREAFQILRRQQWTNADLSISELLLPLRVHGLFTQAYLQACDLVDASGGQVRRIMPRVFF